MEADRLQTDIGLAADIEEAQILQAQEQQQYSTTTTDTHSQDATVKQPKKRFIGRRAAAEVAAKNGVAETTSESGAIQGMQNPDFLESTTAQLPKMSYLDTEY